MSFGYRGGDGDGGTGTSASVTHGVNTNAGDLQVVYAVVNGDFSIAIDSDSGAAWETAPFNEKPATETARHAFFWRTCDGSESTSVSATLGSSQKWGICCSIYSTDNNAEIDSAVNVATNSGITFSIEVVATRSQTVASGGLSFVMGAKDSTDSLSTYTKADVGYGNVESAQGGGRPCAIASQIWTSGKAFGSTEDVTIDEADDSDSNEDFTFGAHISFVESRRAIKVQDITHQHQGAVTDTQDDVLTWSPAPVEGNMLVIGISVDKAPGLFTAPNGWTILEEWAGDNGVGGCVAYKVAGPSESTTFEFAWANNSNSGWSMLGVEYSGIDSVDKSTSADSGSTAVSTQGTGFTGTLNNANSTLWAYFGNDTMDSWSEDSESYDGSFNKEVDFAFSAGSEPGSYCAVEEVSVTTSRECNISATGTDQAWGALVVFYQAAGTATGPKIYRRPRHKARAKGIKCYFIVGNTTLSAGDQLLFDIIQGLGIDILVSNDATDSIEEANTCDFVFESQSVSSSAIGAEYYLYNKPFILNEQGNIDEMEWGTTGSYQASATDIDSSNNKHRINQLMNMSGAFGTAFPINGSTADVGAWTTTNFPSDSISLAHHSGNSSRSVLQVLPKGINRKNNTPMPSLGIWFGPWAVGSANGDGFTIMLRSVIQYVLEFIESEKKPHYYFLPADSVGGGGAISGTIAMTFGQSSDLKGKGAMAGTIPVAFDQSSDLKAKGALGGTIPVLFDQSSDLKAKGALNGAAAMNFDSNASLLGVGSLSGTAAVTFGESANLTAIGALIGSIPLLFGESADLLDSNSGAMSAIVIMTFGSSADLLAVGALVGSSSLLFGSAADLKGKASLSGAIPLLFSTSGNIVGAGALVGSSMMTFGESANLVGAGVLAGSIPLIFGESADLQSISDQLSGTIAMIFGESASLLGAGVLAGTVSISFDSDASLIGFAYATGSIGISFSATGAMLGTGALSGSSDIVFGESASLLGAGALVGTSAMTFGLSGSLLSLLGWAVPSGRTLTAQTSNRASIDSESADRTLDAETNDRNIIAEEP